jgi:hypothetical protein
VADGVDAAVEAVQAPGLHPRLDSVPRHPELPQLGERYHTVLPPGQLGNQGIPRLWALVYGI